MTAVVVPVAGEVVAGSDLAGYTAAWLANRRLSDNTRRAYAYDVAEWLAWCAERGVDPLAARFTAVNAFARELEAAVHPLTGRPLAASSVSRKVSAVSSWYAYLVKLGALERNPAAGADRPRFDRHHTATVGLSRDEAAALIAAAKADVYRAAPRSHALLVLLLGLGVRVAEACRADMADLAVVQGHRTITVHGKGGRVRRRPLPASAAVALDAYLSWRADEAGVGVEELAGPIFVTASGAPLDRAEVFRLVRRLARQAGVESWARLSPHSLRHTWNALARSAGAALEDRQDAMGHADPRTTRRYDRNAASLDRDPAYLVAAALAEDQPETAPT